MPSSEPTHTPTPTPTKTPTLTPTAEPTTQPSIRPTGFQRLLAFFILYFKMHCTSTKSLLLFFPPILLKRFIGIADFCKCLHCCKYFILFFVFGCYHFVGKPSLVPSARPTRVATASPTLQPSQTPTPKPTVQPSVVPTGIWCHFVFAVVS